MDSYLETAKKSMIALTVTIGCWFMYRRSGSKRSYDPKKVIFITGCDSGFGYSLALHIKRSGGSVIAGCYGSFIGEFEGIRALKEAGIQVVNLDVTNLESIKQAKDRVQEILREENKYLYTVVNNAGVLVFGESEWQTTEQIKLQFEVNTLGPVFVSKAFLPILRRTAYICSKPRIVNMVSFCAECPMPTLSIYTSSKSALRSFSDSVRMETSKYGVSIVMFNPGDYPSKTYMCANQGKRFREMSDIFEKDEEDPAVVEYFRKCQRKFENLFPKPPLQEISIPGFYKTFFEIATSPDPKNEYVHSDFMTTLFFTVVNNLPSRWADKARTKLLRLPEYHSAK